MSTIWTTLAVIIYSAVFYGVIYSVRKSPAQQPALNLLLWGGSFGFALIWHSTRVYDALTNWADDSFYSLNLLQQSALITLSLVLIIALFWLAELKSRYLESLFRSWSLPGLSVLLVDIPLTIVTFVLLHKASAQIYYVYYQFIFADLPLQWVINTEFKLAGLVDYLLPDSVNRLSDLLASLALWTLVLSHMSPPCRLCIFQRVDICADHKTQLLGLQPERGNRTERLTGTLTFKFTSGDAFFVGMWNLTPSSLSAA